MRKSKKKNLKVRDLNPKKDAKGGGGFKNQGAAVSGSSLSGSALSGSSLSGSSLSGTGKSNN
jgi:uncharacterized protein YjbI with pentapeptide repeats